MADAILKTSNEALTTLFPNPDTGLPLPEEKGLVVPFVIVPRVPSVRVAPL